MPLLITKALILTLMKTMDYAGSYTAKWCLFLGRTRLSYFRLYKSETVCPPSEQMISQQAFYIMSMKMVLIRKDHSTMGFLLVCSTRSSTYCSRKSSFCCDELTDVHSPADQQLHKRPNALFNHLLQTLASYSDKKDHRYVIPFNHANVTFTL